jgi:hypothetical protein
MSFKVIFDAFKAWIWGLNGDEHTEQRARGVMTSGTAKSYTTTLDSLMRAV